LKKQYKDFKKLHQYLLNTFLQTDEDLYNQIPPLPGKYLQGKLFKKLVGDLQEDLDEYLAAIMANSGFFNLLIVKNFLAEGI